MIERIAEWAPLVGGLWAFVQLLLKTIEFLEKIEKVEEIMEKLPHLLKLLGKFLVYGLSLAIPNVVIIWYFFYLAGLSPDRLSEIEFFGAVVMQPTIFVSLYAYIWAKWIYPRLQRLLGGSKSPQESRRISRASSESSRSGGKKR
jgi:hypothetical protein